MVSLTCCMLLRSKIFAFDVVHISIKSSELLTFQLNISGPTWSTAGWRSGSSSLLRSEILPERSRQSRGQHLDLEESLLSRWVGLTLSSCAWTLRMRRTRGRLKWSGKLAGSPSPTTWTSGQRRMWTGLPNGSRRKLAMSTS